MTAAAATTTAISTTAVTASIEPVVIASSPVVNSRFAPVAAATARSGPSLPVGKCLNYAGQLEVKSDPAWMRPVTEADFADIRAQGFATLRVLVNFERYTAAAAPYMIDAAFLERVRRVIDSASAAGLNVIVENHVSDELRADLSGQKPRFNAMWAQIATAFRGQPGSVWFELLNEPRDQIANADLPALYAAAIAEVRKTNPTRPIIVDGGNWGSIGGMTAMAMPADPYIVPTFHYYDPMRFTHQGAPFLSPVLATGVTWGSDAQYTQLAADVAQVKAFMTSTGRVPFLGEYGVYEGVAVDQRAAYMSDVSRAFASIGVGSCAYGYVNAFPIRTASGGWIRQIVDGLGAPL